MKFDRIGINETEIEVSDAELEELAVLIEQGLEHLKEYDDLHFLKEHNAEYYEHIVEVLREYASYI